MRGRGKGVCQLKGGRRVVMGIQTLTCQRINVQLKLRDRLRVNDVTAHSQKGHSA